MNTPHESTERNSQFVLRTLQITTIDPVLLYNSMFVTIRQNPGIPHEDFYSREPQNQNTIQ